jgi:hypothetical protein
LVNQAFVKHLEDAPDPKEDKLVVKTEPKSKSVDSRQSINSKSLVRAGKKIGAKVSAKAIANALRSSVKTAGKAGGTVLSMPGVLAFDLLASKQVGTDQYGRFLDTPEGLEGAKTDEKIADYYATYGTLPEGTTEGSFNAAAVIGGIEKRMKAEQMANILRQVNRGMSFMQGANPMQETPEQMARKKIRNTIMNDFQMAGDSNRQVGEGWTARGAEVLRSLYNPKHETPPKHEALAKEQDPDNPDRYTDGSVRKRGEA